MSKRFIDCVGDAADVVGSQPDLGADRYIGRLELLQDTPEILLRLAVAVLHCGVEIVDAGCNRARDGALLVGGVAADHQSAHRTAAKAEHRKLHSSAPERSQMHRRSSTCMHDTRTNGAGNPNCPLFLCGLLD
jgi:hypothetical protein